MATFERPLCTCTSRGFFIGLSLDFAFCVPRWPKYDGIWVVAQWD